VTLSAVTFEVAPTAAGAGVDVTMTGQLPDVTVRTDATGAFHFARVFPEGRYSLTARDPLTGGQVQEQVQLAAGQDIIKDLRLKARGRLIVTVVDAAGEAISRAFVKVAEAAFPSRRFEGRLDASTEYRAIFDGVFEGPISIEAFELDGSRGARLSTEMVGGTDVNAVVRLEPVGTVHGRLRMPGSGDLVPFATVSLIANGRVIGQVTTGDIEPQRGTFRFDFVPTGPLRLEASDPATGRVAQAPVRIYEQGEVLEVDLTLQAIGSVTGLVTANGAAQPAAFVEIRSGIQTPVHALTDSTGRYRVDGVPEGPVTVTASLGGSFLAGRVEDFIRTESELLTLDVALRNSTPVTGRVRRFDGTPAPVAVVTVKPRGFGAGGWQTRPTDAEGRFAFDRVADGLADIDVQVPGSEDRGRLQDVAIGPGLPPQEIPLNGTGRLAGTATDASGVPVGGYLTIDGSGAFPYRRTIILPPSGEYSVPDLLAGPVTLSLRNTDSGVARTGTAAGTIAATLDPAAATGIDVALEDSGSVTVLVRRPGGAAAAGVDVEIELRGRAGRIEETTGLDGRATLSGVPLATFVVRITDPLSGGVAYVSERALTANGQTLDLGEVELDITPLTATVDPADGATGVDPFAPVHVTFSQPLFPGFTNGARLYVNGTLLSNFPQLQADGRTLRIPGPLPVNSDITVDVRPTILDVFQRHAVPVTTTFRTIDVPPLSVLSIDPPDGATGVADNVPVTVTFSVPVQTASLRVLRGTTSLFTTVTLSADRRVATITGNWPVYEELTIEVLSTTRDIYDRTLGATLQSRFRTTDVDDVTPPFVRTFTPAQSTVQVPVDIPYVQVEYSEPVSAAGIGERVYLYDDHGIVPATTTVDGAFVRIVPIAPLSANTWYGITARDVVDLNGNVQNVPRFSSFATPDTVPPVLTFTSPVGTSTVDRTPTIEFRWEDAVIGVTPSAATVALTLDGTPVTLNAIQGGVAQYTPAADLALGSYTVAATVTDRAGNTATLARTVTVTDASTTLRVRYLQQDGAPGVGAVVNVSVGGGTYGSATTDNLGIATFTNVPIGTYSVHISEWASSRADVTEDVTITEADLGQVREVTVLQAIRGTVVIRVFAAGRTPLAGAWLSHCSECSNTTGEDGTLTADASVQAGRPWRTSASHWSLPGVSVEGEVVLNTEGETASLEIELPVSVVKGVARFTDGTPIPSPSAVVTWTNAQGQPETAYGYRTPAVPGGYAAFGVPPTAFGVSVQDATSMLVGMAPGVLTDAATPAIVDVTMEASGSITGIVSYAPGQPAEAASVYVASFNGGSASTTTDAEGRYRVDYVSLGEATVYVSAGPFYTQAAGTITADQELVTVDLALPPSGVITGVVRDAAGVPFANASVMAVNDDTFATATAVSDASGVFSVRLPVGPFTVSASTPTTGVTGLATGTLHNPEDVVTADISLPAMARATVTVHRHDGTAVPGAAVYFSGALFGTYVETDVSGTATLQDLPLGDYVVDARDPATGVVGQAVATLTTSGEHVTVVVTLQAPAALSGVVMRANPAEPAAGAYLYVEVSGAVFPSHVVTASTGADGSFSIPVLPPGQVFINASFCTAYAWWGCSASESSSQSFTLTPGEQRSLVITVPQP
jgi:hypothetical protein